MTYKIIFIIILLHRAFCAEQQVKPEKSKTEKSKPEKPVEEFPSVNYLNLRLINNSDFLQIHFAPKENNLEITTKLDLEQYKALNKSRLFKNPPKNTDGTEEKEISPQKITIGFDSGRYVDVIVMSLFPTEENEDQSVINLELGGLLTAAEHVQDFHWSKKDGILVPDAVQSYDLVSFDVANNGSLYSITVSRPWLTCDTQDIQFTLEPVDIWWMMDLTNDETPLTHSNFKQWENLQEENATLVGDEEVGKEGVGDEGGKSKNVPAVLTTTTAKTLIDKNVTLGGGKDESPEEKEAEVLKSIQDHDFQGPIVLSMEKLLQNITYVSIKGCDTQQSSTSKMYYNCSLDNYMRKSKDFKSRFYIAAVSSPLSQTKTTIKSRKSPADDEPLPCPYLIDEGMTTLVKALTGPDKRRHGGNSNNNNKGTRERESRNSASNFNCTYSFIIISCLFVKFSSII